MNEIPGQMTIFDLMPKNTEPEVGEYVTEHGAVICHVMRPGYIGKKVVYSCGTESMPNLCRVGVLEKYFWNHNASCWRSVINPGTKHCVLIDHAPWNTGRFSSSEIFECMKRRRA